jgi:protein involved in polysaccharide export with SLBB domain
MDSGSLVEQVISLEDGGGGDFEVVSRDQVFVLPEESDEGFVYIEGRVRFPGTYPIEQGVTTVRDVVRMAGGLQDDALKRGAYLVRASDDDQLRLRQLAETRQIGRPGSVPVAPPAALITTPSGILTPNEEALRTLRLSNLDFLNRNYLAQELALRSRMPVDLDGDLSLTLADGDRLHVPRDNNYVFVFGQVVRPGFVPYREGARAADYVAGAGGPGLDAHLIYLIEAGTLRFREGSIEAVRSGDMVFVSRSPDTADSAELRRIALEDRRYLLDDRRLRAETRYRTLSAVLQGISAVATVTALIVTLQRN